MQPPRGGHRQARDVAHDRPQPAMPQPFLHTGESRLVIASLDMDDAIRRQAGLFQARREQILLRDAPQHLAMRSRGDPGHETGRRRAVHRAIAAARDLMQTAKSQSTAGQFAVQRRNAEGQHFPRASAITFKLRDSRTKGRNGWTDGALVHLEGRLRVFSRANPVVMFFICSDAQRESI